MPTFLDRRPSLRSVEERNTLVEANLALAAWGAYRFGGGTIRRNESLADDLVQVAMVGLMRAAELWDPAKGSFTTFAVHWIRQTVLNARDDLASTIRIPRTAVPWSDRLALLRKFRCQSIWARTPEGKEEMFAPDPNAIDPSAPAEAEDDLARLWERIRATVGSREFKMLRMFFHARLDSSEVARRLGITRVHTNLLRRNAISKLVEAGIGPGSHQMPPEAAEDEEVPDGCLIASG